MVKNMGLLRLVFWDDDSIRVVSGHSFGDVMGKVRESGVEVPRYFRSKRGLYRKYFQDLTGKSVSLSRVEPPYGLFKFDKGFRAFSFPYDGTVRMVRVSACVARSLRGDGDVLDDLATVTLFRDSKPEKVGSFTDTQVLTYVRDCVLGESSNNVFLISASALAQ